MKQRALLLLLTVALLMGLGAWWYGRTYVVIGGATLRRDVTAADFSGAPVEELEKLRELTALESLDLRDTGLTAAEYEDLKAALPGCDIAWSVPFQCGYLEETVTDLVVDTLTEQDLEQLAYLPRLQSIDAMACRDYEMLARLMELMPELEVAYQVPVDGRFWDRDTREMTLDCGAVKELEAYLPYLKQLKTVTFTGEDPDNEAIYGLAALAPEVEFIWDVQLCGIRVNSRATELILSEIPMESVAEVENALKYFPNLERVEMCKCGIPSGEMDALWKRHPEIRFVWTVYVGTCELRTDETTFMPYKFGYDGFRVLVDADCAELKYCVDLTVLDMGHMGISDYSFLAHMPKLQYLILAETAGTDFSVLAELKELVFLELFLTRFDQAEVLTGLTNLRDLNLGTCRSLTNLEPLKEMTWLERLWFPGVRILWEEQRELVEALPDTQICFDSDSSTGSGWRLSPHYRAMRDLLDMFYLYD